MDEIKLFIAENNSSDTCFFASIDDETIELIERTKSNTELLECISSMLNDIEDIEITSKIIKHEFEFHPYVYFTYNKLNIKYSLTITYNSRSYPYWLLESD